MKRFAKGKGTSLCQLVEGVFAALLRREEGSPLFVENLTINVNMFHEVKKRRRVPRFHECVFCGRKASGMVVRVGDDSASPVCSRHVEQYRSIEGCEVVPLEESCT